jgi:hypothetical protein
VKCYLQMATAADKNELQKVSRCVAQRVSWLVPHPIVIWLTYGIYGMLCMYVCRVVKKHW